MAAKKRRKAGSSTRRVLIFQRCMKMRLKGRRGPGAQRRFGAAAKACAGKSRRKVARRRR